MVTALDDHLAILDEEMEILEFLTPREREYLSLRHQGLSQSQIIRTMEISPRTYWHYRNTCRKMYEHYQLGGKFNASECRRIRKNS